jgi:glycosidase
MGDLRRAIWLWALWVFAFGAAQARAVDESAPAILQMYEAKWTTIEDRMADIFQAGYGQMWLPPPQRADSSNFSVGYDLFDRFDLGQPRNETLYGTENTLTANIAAAHRASVSIYTDYIPNHNGFGTREHPAFVALGGYPGFALTLPGAPHNDINGDFHDPSASGDIEGRLAGLIDIAQEKNHQFIRHPIAEGPNNIPAGTTYNKPNPNNARLYPDQGLGGTVLNDPALGGNFTRYNFNATTPLAGDPVMENAMGLLMRNAQWMVEVIGVDGFRIDAAKHMPTWVLNYVDQAVFRANPRLQHDGSIKPVFMFSEVLDGNKGFVQSFIRKNLPNPTAIDPSNTTVGGNRDALDFPLFFAMRDNLSGNGFQNNWHAIRNASQDTQDDGLRNGSQGVAFVDSHDNLGGGFPYLYKVAYAYTLMRPGNALVYLNAREFGDNREFPHNEGGNTNPMSDDALGGFHGDAIAKLVEIRNSHGRGNFHERWLDNAFNPNGFSNIYVYERSNSAVVGLNSRLDSGFDERAPVQTDFAPGTVLVELTGNAADAVVDPGGNIPEAIRVNGSGQVTIRIPRNASHGKGYVVYGVAPPQGSLSISDVSQVLPGATPTPANNGTARLAAIDVISADSFSVQLETDAVTLPAPMGEVNPVRDFNADGDQALVRIDGGMNLNNLPGIDVTDPSDVSYGFENFTNTRLPGYVSDGMGGNIGPGDGLYVQNIDATQLSEGRHYVTVRAYRHRDVSGTPVFSDFKRTIYIDRLPPEAEIVSFDPFASNPGNPNNRDMIVRSVDATANNMHIFLDLPANMSDAAILNLAQQGVNRAGFYDRDQFVLGFTALATGNHVATIVTFEPTGNHSIQRVPGMFTATAIGAGFGDMFTGDGYTVSDIRCVGMTCNNNSVEDILYSQNNKFRAQFDVNGDGLGDNRDLFALGDELVAGGAGQAVLDSYTDLLLKRGDVNSSGTADGNDVAAMYASFGSPSWLMDMNVDGAVDIDDVSTMIAEVFRTVPGDFNVDGSVDAADYVLWRKGLGAGTTYSQGDADLDGDVDSDDLAAWQSAFGFARQPLMAGAGSAALAVPEPGTMALAAIVFAIWGLTTTTLRTQRKLGNCQR